MCFNVLWHFRERRIENEVERTAELHIGRNGASGAGAGTAEEGAGGATGGVAVVSVQSIESVKVSTFITLHHTLSYAMLECLP